MYKDQHWWLRLSLILWDTLISISAFTLAGLWRFGKLSSFVNATDFHELVFITFLSSIVAFMLSRMYRNFLSRGCLREIVYVLQYNCWIIAFLVLYAFSTKNRMELSRLTLIYFAVVDMPLLLFTHYVIKMGCNAYAGGKRGWKLLIVTDMENVSLVCKNVSVSQGWRNKAASVYMLDQKAAEESVLYGLPIIDPETDCLEYLKDHPVDEVLLSVRGDRFRTNRVGQLLHEFLTAGVVVSVRVQFPETEIVKATKVSQIGSLYVASFADREYDFFSLLVKRAMDIVGGLVGLVIAFIVGLFVAPAIMLESPGAFLFKQQRVGRNGRIFTMYKFRSMYKDAETHKKELLDRNQMQGPLFKMDDDPRITMVGKFIRKTSIDELPQFFNVLVGDMSLVGTRPPTVDEYEHYTNEYKKRLSFRPGLTGIWQTSGRNDVTDFNDVMKMDLQYITDWSISLDAKLLMKTVRVVLLNNGAK